MAQAEGTPDVPSMGRRQFMNLLTFGTVTGVALGALYPVVNYFIPPSSGGSGGGVTAKDALGNDIIVSEFLANHNSGERTLAQGLKGDPTYVVIEGEQTLAEYGLNAVWVKCMSVTKDPQLCTIIRGYKARLRLFRKILPG